MYAVVSIAGHQYKVGAKDTITVPSIEAPVGATISFQDVLLIAGEGKVTVGAPTVKGATVQATVLSHGKSEKVIVFKKKRRKGYRVRRGHRQGTTALQITNVG